MGTRPPGGNGKGNQNGNGNGAGNGAAGRRARTLPENGANRSLTRQGQERKQQLLDHAAELFAARGYADTRVVDIVEAAGVAKGLHPVRRRA